MKTNTLGYILIGLLLATAILTIINTLAVLAVVNRVKQIEQCVQLMGEGVLELIMYFEGVDEAGINLL